MVVYVDSSGARGTLSDGQTGNTSSDTQISLSTETVGAVIYYTTDGSIPDPRSGSTRRFLPNSPLTLAVANPTVETAQTSLALAAVAIGPNMKPSLVTRATVVLQYPQAAAPEFSPGQGVYTSDQRVVLTSATPGASIYYTMVDGNGPAPRPTPGQHGTTKYEGALYVTGPSSTVTICAIAVKAQVIDSASSSATYSVGYPGLAQPVFYPGPGNFDCREPVWVAITSDPGSTIYYIINGISQEPVPSGTRVELRPDMANDDGTVLLSATATMEGWTPSPPASGRYYFTVTNPLADPGTDTFFEYIYVDLACPDSAAEIWYAVNGSDPVPHVSPAILYSVIAPVHIIATGTTLRVVAHRDGYADSEVRTFVYTLQASIAEYSHASDQIWSNVETVMFGSITPTSHVHYTIDDPNISESSPTGSSAEININGHTTVLRTLVHAPGFEPSPIDTTRYSLALLPPEPFISYSGMNVIGVSSPGVSGANGYEVCFRGISGGTGPIRTFTFMPPGQSYSIIDFANGVYEVYLRAWYEELSLWRSGPPATATISNP